MWNRQRGWFILGAALTLCGQAQAQEKIAFDQVTTPRIGPRLTVREDAGDGLGYTRGFSYLEGFLPLWQDADNALLFFNGRAVNFNRGDRWETNLGGGLRRYSPRLDAVLGVNSFFDWRDTGPSIFRQVGLGLEAAGQIADLRSNLYLPVGPQRHQVAEGFGNPRFAGHLILLDHSRVFDVALRGFDLEAGLPIPALRRWGARAYAGYYHYENSGAPSVDGVRARLEAQVNDWMSTYFSIQNDRAFDTTVSGGVALHFGGRRPAGIRRTNTDLLAQRVVRDVDVVVSRNVQKTVEPALDVLTGLPIIVQHANSKAPAGGDGTVEKPFQTLADQQAASAPRNFLFVHAGSVHTGQAMVLQNDQRFLGEGIDHLFTARQGTFLLPRATTGTILPLLESAPLNAVTLANDTEVAGFQIANAANAGIFGLNVGGNIVIRNNTLTGNPFGVLIDTNTNVNLAITGNRIDKSDDGVLLVFRGGSVSNLMVKGNSIEGVVGSIGLIIASFDTSQVTGNVCGNTFNNNDVGIFILGFGASKMTLGIFENKINGGDNGLLAASFGTSRLGLTVTSNTFSNNASVGTALISDDSSTFEAVVTNNTVTGTPSIGFAGISTATSTMCLGLHNNSSTGTSAAYLLNQTGASLFQLEADGGTNAGLPFLTIGTITPVPAGTCIP